MRIEIHRAGAGDEYSLVVTMDGGRCPLTACGPWPAICAALAAFLAGFDAT